MILHLKYRSVLILGDLFAILIVTILGFATHAEAGIKFFPRLAAAFLPLTFSWFLIAPWFGLFNSHITSDLRQLWRPALGMLLAGPFAVVLRGLILNSPIVPIFAVVLSTVCALGLVIWRSIHCLLGRSPS